MSGDDHMESAIKEIAARAHCGHWDGDAEALIRAGYQAARAGSVFPDAPVPYDHNKSLFENLKATGLNVVETTVEAMVEAEITSDMKARCMGEIMMPLQQTCSACFYHEAQEDCEVCGGEVTYADSVVVPWTTMKEIYKLMTRSKYEFR